MNASLYFLVMSLVCVFIESFFSMFEMAVVSLNKVKLYYWAGSQRSKKAKWLEFLLSHPSYFFGTTLIVVSSVMQIGSEAARRFYESINLNPDFAPVTQILMVVIFGELSPLFAARKHSENVAYLFIPIVYPIAIMLTPLIWVIDQISKASNLIFGKSKYIFFLSKDELQKVLEEPTKKTLKFENEDINNVVSNIFLLKNKKAKEIMISLAQIKAIPSDITVNQIKSTLNFGCFPYFPIYHKNPLYIVAIAYPRDLLKANEAGKVIDYGKAPWFITEDTDVLDVLKQFRTNNQSISVVLDKTGKNKGFITLDQIEDEIFGKYPLYIEKRTNSKVLIEKTISGDMTLEEFNEQFKANLHYKNAATINELIIKFLDHHPSTNEIINFDKYEFTIAEMSLLGIEKVKVKTLL
ncbi:MAG: hypothetical protein ACD_7C00437G0004 [uncultured bacterium]|nr:MAG: hypothetical protein ACD_7C00437G0004 [uncultured bacterium]